MTLTQLQYALDLALYGSFKKAAEKLNISQPALSMQIQKLEEEVELVLFNRSSNPVQPTSDGLLFLERAQEVVAASKRLLLFSNRLHENFEGSLKIGIIPTLAPFLVPLFAESLQQELPQLKLEIVEYLTEKIVKEVQTGALDAGIISIPVQAYGIYAIPLFYEKFYFYTAEPLLREQRAINLQDIPYDKLWLLEENCFRDQVSNFCDLNKIRRDKNFIYRSNSIDALIRIVDNRGGITILPELSTLSLTEKQEENLKAIAGKAWAREIGLITTHSPGRNRFIEKLQAQILANIPRSMLSAEGLEVVLPEIKMAPLEPLL